MKKLFTIIASVMLMIGISSCTCTNQKDVVNQINEPVVENTIAVDRQDMYMNFGEEYRWYETVVVLNNYLDEECDGTFESVSNIFQGIVEDRTEDGRYCADTYVVTYVHTGDNFDKQVVEGFWIEDCALNEEVINLSFKEAYEKVVEVNLPKPHSRHAILRKPVGPKDCNPQWVFGNISEQIWIDAVTGEARNSDPSFDGLNLGTPLGEWP